MSDTPYKHTSLPLTFSAPAPAKVSSPAGLYSAPFADALRAQDTLHGARRQIHAANMGGAGEWLAPSEAINDAAQNQPTDAWRVIGRARVMLAAAQAIEGRILSIPSGPVVKFETLGGWQYASAGGRVRWTVEHDNATDTGESVLEQHLPASDLEDQLEPQGAGAAWLALQCHYIPPVRPAGASLDPAEAVKWSEPHDLEITYEHRGAPRVISAALHEVPVEHTVEHDTDATTLHDYAAALGQPHPDAFPQTSSADGATYEERRNGTRRGLEVAARQRQRVVPGPIIWTSYSERTTEPGDTEFDPVSITSTSLVRISTFDAGQFGFWLADAPGFDLLAHYSARAPENLASRSATVRTLPVLARVYARFTTTGSQTGRVVWATSERSRISVGITAISTSWAWWSIRGWLEGTASPDDTYPMLQDFARVTSGTMEIRAWSVTIGDFTAGT